MESKPKVRQEQPLTSLPDEESRMPATALERYVPLFCWAMVLLCLLLIPLKIISYGFIPGGDARRHFAKVFTDKPYTDIVVMRPEYVMDHSPGWEWVLRFAHRLTGLNRDGLVSLSVVALLLFLFVLPLLWLRRPEAWLAALLAELVAIPELMTRFVQTRPFLISEGILIALLFAWWKPGLNAPSWQKLLLTSIAFAASAWMHGAWYLWVLLLAAFVLAGHWRTVGWLTLCWIAGTFAGALLTGRPVAFLEQAVTIARLIASEHVPSWLLVGELSPSDGEFATLALVAIVFLWRKNQNQNEARLYCTPVLWLIAIGWILGFYADRFWADWGMPAVLVWLAMQFEEIMTRSLNAVSLKRLLVTGMVALPLFLDSTNDLDARYTQNFRESFLDASDPNLKGWLPGPKGIFYCAQMQFFYNTFYMNPQADWRYILGFEPALMREEDLKILRSIQRNPGDPRTYEPWIQKMQPADRLVIYSPVPPALPELEWHDAINNIWIGRLPGGR